MTETHAARATPIIAARRQVIDEEFLEAVEALVARARAGEIIEVVIVANDSAGQCYHRMSDFRDAWRLLGALEYAKTTVLASRRVVE